MRLSHASLGMTVLLAATLVGCGSTQSFAPVLPQPAFAAQHQIVPQNRIEAALNTQLLTAYKGSQPEVHELTVKGGTFTAEVHNSTRSGGTTHYFLDTLTGTFSPSSLKILTEKVVSHTPEAKPQD